MNKNDNIDYKIKMDLINTFWKGKLTIIIISTIFVLFAILYTVHSDTLWSTSMKFNINKNFSYPKKTQLLLDELSVDKETTNEVKSLFSQKNITEEYVKTIKSLSNKIDFIKSDNPNLSDDYIRKLAINMVVSESDGIYNLNIQGENKKLISEIISGYIIYSKNIASKNIIIKVDAILEKNKIIQALKLKKMVKIAKIKIEIEKKKAEYGLKIADKVGIINPISSCSDTSFDFYLGSKALSEKIAILNNIKDLSIISPEIYFITDNIKSLENISIPNNFKIYNVVMKLEQPVFKVNSKKNKIIIIISAIIGLFFGFSFILITNEYNK